MLQYCIAGHAASVWRRCPGRPAGIYFFRDSQGNEIDFIIPEGDRLSLYECKWSFRQGKPPKNIAKFRAIVKGAGPERKNLIKMSKIISTADEGAQIEKFCKITNFIDF